MALGTSAILALATQCAPSVAPVTIAAIVDVESGGHIYAINVNKLAQQPRRPKSAGEAIRTARRYIARGHSVDLGLGQINSRNMRWLGLSWDTIFDPCINIATAGHVLSTNYRSVRGGRHPQSALRIALSLYNTGSKTRGFRNGYVRKVERAGFRLARNTGSAGPAPSSTTPVSYPAASLPAAASMTPAHLAQENLGAATNTQSIQITAARPARWDVFARAEYARTQQPIEEH